MAAARKVRARAWSIGAAGLASSDQALRMDREIEEVAGEVGRQRRPRWRRRPGRRSAARADCDREAGLQRRDQPVDVVVPAPVRKLDRLAAREAVQRRRQVGRARASPRLRRAPARRRRREAERELDLEADEVGRVVEPAAGRRHRWPASQRAAEDRRASTVDAAIARRIAATKSSPATNSRSRRTRSSPKCASSASASLPVALSLSRRRVGKENLGHGLLAAFDPSRSLRRGSASALAPRRLLPCVVEHRRDRAAGRAERSRSRNSICALALRSSSAASRSISAHSAGSMRSGRTSCRDWPSAIAAVGRALSCTACRR